jgi:hypothetical protein
MRLIQREHWNCDVLCGAFDPARLRLLLQLALSAALLALASRCGAQTQAAPQVSVRMPAPGANAIDPLTNSPIAGKSPMLPKPAFPVSDREVRTFTTEVVYNFAHYDFTPAVLVQPVSRSGVDTKTPEGACIGLISAMQQKDYEWFLSLWDNKSAADIRDQDLQHGGPEPTKKDWQDMFVGRRVELTERIESGLYVAILFRVYKPGVATPALNSALVFKQEGGRWEATNETEMTNSFVILYQGQTAKDTRKGILTPLLNGTGHLGDGELNPEDVAQTIFLEQYPKGKTTATHVMQ